MFIKFSYVYIDHVPVLIIVKNYFWDEVPASAGIEDEHEPACVFASNSVWCGFCCLIRAFRPVAPLPVSQHVSQCLPKWLLLRRVRGGSCVLTLQSVMLSRLHCRRVTTQLAKTGQSWRDITARPMWSRFRPDNNTTWYSIGLISNLSLKTDWKSQWSDLDWLFVLESY